MKLNVCVSLSVSFVSQVTHSPPVVHNQVEDAQNHDQKHGAHLGLETNRNHDTSHKAEDAHNDAPDAPLARKDEAKEQEDEQDATSELHIHLAVLLVNLRQARWRELLAYPRVAEHHQQTADNGQVAQEEVEVEYETVAEGLGHDDAEEPEDCEFGLLACDDHGGAGGHGDDVDDEEQMRYAAWDCVRSVSTACATTSTSRGNRREEVGLLCL